MNIKIDLLYQYLERALTVLSGREYEFIIRHFSERKLPKSLNSYYYAIDKKEYFIQPKGDPTTSYFSHTTTFSSQIDTIIYKEEKRYYSDIIDEKAIRKIIFEESKIPSCWAKILFETLKEYQKEQQKNNTNILYLKEEYALFLNLDCSDIDELERALRTRILNE